MSHFKTVCAITVTAWMLAFSHQSQATIYNISLDGSVIDLTGFIEINTLGTFNPTEFDSLVIDYSITASGNGAYPFTFTSDNSTWGPVGFGSAVEITVFDSLIQLVAPSGGNYQSVNAFLLADEVTNNSRENLLFSGDQLRYRTPNPPNTSIFETVQDPFIMATATSQVPEPGTLLLMSLGMLGFGFARYKKN